MAVSVLHGGFSGGCRAGWMIGKPRRRVNRENRKTDQPCSAPLAGYDTCVSTAPTKYQAQPGAIARRRASGGLSLDALARLLGISVASMWRIERGIHCVYADRASLIAEHLFSHTAALFQEAPPWGKRATPASPSPSPKKGTRPEEGRKRAPRRTRPKARPKTCRSGAR